MTKIEGTTAQIIRTIGGLPWGELCDRTANGLRACWVAAQLLLALAAIGWQVAYEHREQIRQAVVATIAACWLAARVTYRAGCWCRLRLEALSSRSAALLPQQPLVPVAPITASLQALREALEALVRRLYPVAA